MLHNRRKAEIEVLASVQRKAAICGDLGRLAGDHAGSTGDLSTMSEGFKPTEPPALITYLVDKMNAIVDTYNAKYA